ncbi:MAG: AAA family ATPase [Desulfovibrio sp.]|jgi:predicted ATP-dependent protease|nr:AAA family ATPase [Desulfovibrio sp.]
MRRHLPLSAEKLQSGVPPEHIPYTSSEEIPVNGHLKQPQPRALQALELALHIAARDFNIYLAGEPDLGRSFLLREFLAPKAKKGKTPPDLIYIFNFDDHDSPLCVTLAAGQGRKLKAALNKAFVRIQKEIALRLERNAYAKRRTSLMGSFQTRKEELLKQMNRLAGTQGFYLGTDASGGMTLYPLVEGKRLNENEFENLEETLRNELKMKGDSLMEPISGFLRKLARAEQDFYNQERSLEREMLDDVLKNILDPLAEKFSKMCNDDALRQFFASLRNDTLDRPEAVMPPAPEAQSPYPHDSPIPDNLSTRYDVNLFVDNAATSGAPIIFDDHPTLSNLMGCIEREAEMGTLITDFTLIKAGSIHRANGGYLVLHMDDMLQYPQAWESLLRALRSGMSRIEDAGEEEGNKAKGLRPQGVPLSLKVVLVGGEDLYEMLLQADDRFSKLFKIKAHLTGSMRRDSMGIRTYLLHIRRIINNDSLLHFDREAMADLVNFGSRLIEDQKKLSLKYPLVRELMVEASACASLKKSPLVTRTFLQQAIKARTFRANLVEESFMEEYDQGIIKVRTSGEAVGKVNGLAVSFYGGFEFGLPHQISCTVGVGSGGIIDLERDAQLSGPIHTKAMMILKSYLVGAFAHNKPLVLTGSLGFEQNYAGIEGDSASGAELAALLSALSRVPVRLDYAFTGAVDQSGQIMAVGGVTRKVEGFFEVCKRHGLTGRQGVLLPKDNITHLLPHDEIVAAVTDGRFHIHAVEHITEAMEILSGLPAGKLGKNGDYSPGSLYRLADDRLKELAALSARKTGKKTPRAD